MIRFILRRLVMVIPFVFGISLVTFVLVNLAMGTPDGEGIGVISGSGARVAGDDMGRAYGLHLPLFVNLSIDDVSTLTRRDIVRLSEPEEQELGIRSLVGRGGAALPYLVPKLPGLEKEARAAAIEALDQIGHRIGLGDDLATTQDKSAFWARYWDIYGSDFTPVRAALLVRRYSRRDDHLALAELRRLDTFCLPEIMRALPDSPSPEGLERLVDLLGELSGRQDPVDARSSAVERSVVVSRWQEWWNQRYDLYTSFEGIRRLTGIVTETRYYRWLSRIVRFDFGVSARDGRPIRTKIAQRMPITLLLSFLALGVAYLIAIPLGLISAIRRGSLFDRGTTVIMFVVYSLPAFWVAMLLLRYVGSAGYLNWFPAQGLTSPEATSDWSFFRRATDLAHHLFLPVLCLSLVSIAMLTRYQRIGMLRVAEQDFIRTARAKGLSETRVILKHGLRNGLMPLVTMMGLQLPFLVSGSVVIERIFGIQGMGMETFEAIRSNDYTWLMAVVTVTAVLTMLGILASDVIYAVVDPRIVPGRRFGRSA